MSRQAELNKPSNQAQKGYINIFKKQRKKEEKKIEKEKSFSFSLIVFSIPFSKLIYETAKHNTTSQSGFLSFFLALGPSVVGRLFAFWQLFFFPLSTFLFAQMDSSQWPQVKKFKPCFLSIFSLLYACTVVLYMMHHIFLGFRERESKIKMDCHQSFALGFHVYLLFYLNFRF